MLTGRVDEAKRIFDELDQRSRKQYVSAYHIARVHAGLGEGPLEGVKLR